MCYNQDMISKKFITDLAQKAGDFITKQHKKSFKIEEKTRNDFVTDVDKGCEKLITREIAKTFPDHAILGEEASFQKSKNDYLQTLADAEYIWIIDPIDGTNNYIRNIPFFCVSIGVFKTKSSKASKNYEYLEGELVLGTVYAPALNKLYFAQKGKGAYLNGKKIHANNQKKLERAVFSTGFHGEYKMFNVPYFAKLLENIQGIRRHGSAALDICAIAEGSHEGFWEFGLKPWDIAAGCLIAKEAGAKVTDANGNLLDLFGKDILVTNGKIHNPTVEIFKSLD